jgi:hypothetical protein
MYSRSYSSDDTALRIPEGYDGTALMQKNTQEAYDTKKSDHECHEPNDPPPDHSEPTFSKCDGCCCDNDCTSEKKGFFERMLSGVMPKSFSIKGFFNKIGLEELLIIGVALFLFFSHDSDKECALMLLVLLFIN